MSSGGGYFTAASERLTRYLATSLAARGNDNMAITAADLELDQTCEVFPEQYNVYYRGQQVGYIRRRWDSIWVHAPNVFGEVVHEAADDLSAEGLQVAVEAIANWFNDKYPPR